jgi:hypothetical protein
VGDGSTTWIEETRDAADRASNLVRAQAEFETLVSIDEELENALSELAPLDQAAGLGRGTWWAGVDAPADLWAELRSARRDLEPRITRSVTRQLAQFGSRVREAILIAWKKHVAAEAGDPAELRDLVQVLSGTEELADLARGLYDALARLEKLRRGLPDANALNALEEVVARLDTLEQRLPATAKAFLSAAARGGASLELLDAQVWGWLEVNGALRNFRVVPGAPQGAKRG